MWAHHPPRWMPLPAEKVFYDSIFPPKLSTGRTDGLAAVERLPRRRPGSCAPGVPATPAGLLSSRGDRPTVAADLCAGVGLVTPGRHGERLRLAAGRERAGAAFGSVGVWCPLLSTRPVAGGLSALRGVGRRERLTTRLRPSNASRGVWLS